jgi:hypothetical protein
LKFVPCGNKASAAATVKVGSKGSDWAEKVAAGRVPGSFTAVTMSLTVAVLDVPVPGTVKITSVR